MKLSDGEKLIAVMLADLLDAQGVKGEIDTTLLKSAISGGDLWALKWEYSGLFDAEERDPNIVTETSDILSMCSFIEYSIAQLSDQERNQIPQNSQVVFVGFDGNHDDHFGVASMFIQEMGRWGEFKNRSLNSHGTVLPKYRRMREVFDGIGGPRSGGFTLGEIQAILNA
jgi:uncharacterized protein YfbU (UPF0304 family)